MITAPDSEPASRTERRLPSRVLPVEPSPSRYRFAEASRAPSRRPLGIGGDLEPGTLLEAYRHGIFPWPDEVGQLLWWSPDPRAVLPLDSFHESRSLRRRRRQGQFTVSLSKDFEAVVRGCADRPEGTWITDPMVGAYTTLHELGWAESIEVSIDSELVGGLYGVVIGGLFAAESMFHRVNDASKVAVAELVEILRSEGFVLLDVQILTDHLASLGAVEIPRSDYLGLLDSALGARVSFPDRR